MHIPLNAACGNSIQTGENIQTSFCVVLGSALEVTSFGLVSSFYVYHSDIYIEDFTFFNTIKV